MSRPPQGKIAVLIKLIFQQFSVLFIYFYDAPTPSDVFEDFLAIPAITGDVTTRSFSDLVNLLTQAQYNDQRSVVRLRRMIEYLLIRHMLRVFYDAAPVTTYSAPVFDTFVNQTKVSGPYDKLRPEYEHSLSSGVLNTQTLT